jgi:hypothetical protein
MSETAEPNGAQGRKPEDAAPEERTWQQPRLTVFGTVADLTQKAHVGGDVSARSFGVTSDRNAKTEVQPVDAQRVLRAVAAMEITSWRYRDEPSSVRHLGPMAQDFSEALGLGDSERHIHVVDGLGTALAAIKALAALEARSRGSRIPAE